MQRVAVHPRRLDLTPIHFFNTEEIAIDMQNLVVVQKAGKCQVVSRNPHYDKKREPNSMFQRE